MNSENLYENSLAAEISRQLSPTVNSALRKEVVISPEHEEALKILAKTGRAYMHISELPKKEVTL
jgi:hypothetical protein